MICRYLIFANIAYELNGMNDCIGQTWIFKKAINIIKKHRIKHCLYCDYYTIYDLLKNKEIYNKDRNKIIECCGGCFYGIYDINSSNITDFYCKLENKKKKDINWCNKYKERK